MGSIVSSPKRPTPAPQVVYVPAPQTPASTPTPTAPVLDPVKEASDARAEGLLSRGRGRFGTIVTGFRGLLGQSNSDVQRKTLLGE